MNVTTRRLWVWLPVVFSMLVVMSGAGLSPAGTTQGEGWRLEAGVLTIENDAGHQALAALLSDHVSADWPYCTQVETIAIGQDMWAPISPVFAQRLPNLAAYQTQQDHEFYSAVDGVLLGGGDGSQLWAYPPAKADTSYTVPSTVTVLAPFSFSHNTLLEAVFITPQVMAISNQAFDNSCTRLTDLHVAPENTMYSSQDGVLFSQNNLTLWRYLPARRDTSYTIPEGVEFISGFAFAGNPPIERLHLPKTLAQFDENFRGFPALQAIEVDSANPYLVSDPVGALFGREDKVLLAFPLAAVTTDYVIPEGVEKIAPHAFSGTTITALSLPNSLTHIGERAFAHCDGLSYVGLPIGLKQLDSGAFAENSALSTLWFQGVAPPTVAADAFTGCDALSALFVPRGHGALYKAAMAAYATLLQERTYIAADGWTLDNDTVTVSSPDGLAAFCTLLTTSDWPYAKEVTMLQLADSVVITDFAPLAALSLQSYQISPTHPAYTVDNGILLNKSGRILIAYPAAKTVTDYTLPTLVKDLHPQAFLAADHLKTLTLSRDFAPSNPVGFALGAGVHTLSVPADNAALAAHDGVLFSKDGTRLLRYPPARPDSQYTVPDGVTHLACNSFLNGAERLQDLTLPGSLLHLDTGSLDAAIGLQLVTFSGMTPPSLSADFVLPNLRAVTIPAGSLAQYQQSFTPWSTLFLEGGGTPNPPPVNPDDNPGNDPGGIPGGSGGVMPPPPKPTTQPGYLAVPATVHNNIATCTVPADGLQAAITTAPGNTVTLSLSVPANTDAHTIAVTLPHAAVAKIPPLQLKIITPLGTLRLDAPALSALVQTGTGDVFLQLAAADQAALPTEVASRPAYTLSAKNGTTPVLHLDGGTLTLTLPYTHAATENPNSILVQQLTDAGNILPQLGLYRPDKANITARLRQFGTYFIGHFPVNFTDVPPEAWFSPAVTVTAAQGLFFGTGGEFSPNEPMTRGMFATVLARLNGADLSGQTVAYFSDVAANAWYASAVNWAASRNILSGYGSGQFGPDDPITREQMAAILHNYSVYLADFSLPQGDFPAFSDQETISPWATQGVQTLQSWGLLQGNGGNYNPKSTATRAEISKLLCTYIELLLNLQ